MLDQFKDLDCEEYKIKIKNSVKAKEIGKSLSVLISLCRKNKFFDLRDQLLTLNMRMLDGEVIYDGK